MAEKKSEQKFHVSIDQIENGWEVSCYRDKKPTLSQKAGWIPSSYESPKRYSFASLEEALKHVKSEEK